MPRKKHGRSRTGGCIEEHLRISINLSLKDFLNNEKITELTFPSSLNADERAYIHELASQRGLKSKSRGKGSGRYLTVYKREGSSIVHLDPAFVLHRPSRDAIWALVRNNPITSKEHQDLLPLVEQQRADNGEVRDQNKTLGRLNNGIPQVPVLSTNPALLEFRKSLPIWPMRDDIVQTIINSQVTVISGQTGSGKTTQVPQFLVEHYASTGAACRIICTQPRRISAVSVSERVSAERNEPVGRSVGYQIRLEGRVSPRTVLTYCTDGVLLRTLMGGDSSLASVTHVIVDEVHERNRFSDFLLIALKEALVKFPSLRLTLMSATVDTSVFTKYFGDCPVITVPGRQYDVEEFFLEDILKCTGYMSNQMTKVIKDQSNRLLKRAELEKWSRYVPEPREATAGSCDDRQLARHYGVHTQEAVLEVPVELYKADVMDELISDAWMQGTAAAYDRLLKYVSETSAAIDHQHSISSVTPLMVAACRGNVSLAEQLLNLGANIHIRASNDLSALDWAKKQQHQDVVDMLEVYMNETGLSSEPDPLLQAGDSVLPEDEKVLLDMYHQSFNDENIDFDLLMILLSQIHTTADITGAILVFIAGYEDIVTLRERILNDDKVFREASNYALYTLHSNMQTSDQKRVFRPTQRGVRKIILATNIAETSITIDDVVHVVDCGKVKEKSFDCMSGVCMLRSTWISQACAKQRRGRAGRTAPGVCYHTFSSVRYLAMQPFHTPEILRLPLHELCLHTKLLAPAGTSIAEFLGKAIEPPSFMVTKNAVELLKTMDALNSGEGLTELGHHLLDLPVEPRLGKILLYSIVLKCLDPILTIVCCMSYKDPFVLPTQPHLRRAAQQSRQALSFGTLSDHMALLRVFQAWQAAKAKSKEREFCDKNFVSASVLEMVQGTRTQLLGQLRASGFVRARGLGEIKDLNVHSHNWCVVKAALCAGMYPNLIRVDREHTLLRTATESRVMFHPSSTIRDTSTGVQSSIHASNKVTIESLPSDWLIFEELNRNNRFCHARSCTLISPITVALFAGPSRMTLEALAEGDPQRCAANDQTDSDSESEDVPPSERASVRVDKWVVFRVDAEAAHLGLQLRQKWNALFLRRMQGPEKLWTPKDEAVLQAVVDVLTIEERALRLVQPPGIGQRPRIGNIDLPGGSRGSDAHDAVNHVVQPRFHPQRRADMVQPEVSQKVPLPSEVAATSNIGYFIIKALTMKAIHVSLATSSWAFAPKVQRVLLDYLRSGTQIVLVFSVQGSGHFQGYARLCGDRPQAGLAESWADLTGRNCNPPLAVEWVKRADVPFPATRHLLNPFNDNQRVQMSRDGQQIERKVGEDLCSLWNKAPNYVRPPDGAFRPATHARGYPGAARSFGPRPGRSFPHNNYYNSSQQHN